MAEIGLRDSAAVEEAADLVAREHAAAQLQRPGIPDVYCDARYCHGAVTDLLVDGFSGFVAYERNRCVGVMCGRTTDGVGFVPAQGLAVDPDLPDPTAVVVGLFTEAAPVLVAEGASRFTIDHVDLNPLGIALNNVAFGRGAVFATQPARRTEPRADLDVRIGSAIDLDNIATLSHLEFTHRTTPPIYAPPQPRSIADTRTLHEELLAQRALHFLARHDGRDIALVTVEFTSPAPRLCANGQPYIGPTATHPTMQGQGVGRALVDLVLDWAHTNGYQTVSVDFDSCNPRSRPFWLGLGFEPTGYRMRRTLDAAYVHPRRLS